jgi:hypothetical protein
MTEQHEQALERMGQLIDKLDSIGMSMQMPVPAEIHLKALRESVPEIRNEIRAIYDQLGGEDVWSLPGETV